MPTLLPEIRAAWWSPKLGEIGAVVQDWDDINQAIAIILTTPKGTDPHRPEFASSIHDWIDYPTNSVSAHLVREVYEAILTWEPRVEVTRVEVTPNYLGEIQRMLISTEWALKEGGITGGVEVLV